MYTRRATFRKAAALLATAISPARTPGASGSITVPFQYAAGRGSLLVRARINGKSAMLILDTGSSHIVVRPTLVGIDPSRLQRAQSRSGLVGDALGMEVSLEVGGQVFSRRVSVMDLSDALAVYQERIDGLLGLDFLLQFSKATINLKDRALTFDL
jgi:predicted aspartyl protease